MAPNDNIIIPAMLTHPGIILKKELKARGIKQKDFARAIGMPAPNLSELIKGKRNLTELIALRLEEALGIPFQHWMNLQNRYYYISKLKNGTSVAEVEVVSPEYSQDNKYSAHILADIRKKSGMTQAQLASRIGKDRNFISRVERGLSIPSIATFYQMVSAMGRCVRII